MSDRAYLRLELEAVLRANCLAVRELNVFLNELRSPYRQFSLQLDESVLGGSATLSKKVAHSAVFAHAPQVSDQVASKFDAWEWAKHHARMHMDAPPEASFGRRGVISGTASAFGRALIAMVRAKYALQWPLYLRTEFVTPRQAISARRMNIFR